MLLPNLDPSRTAAVGCHSPRRRMNQESRSIREGAEINQMHSLPGGGSGFLVRTFSCSEKPQPKYPRRKISPVRSAGFPSQKVLALALALCVEELFALHQPHVNSLEKSTWILMLYWIKARKSNILYFSFPSCVHKMISSNSSIHKIINFFFFK